MNDEGSKERHSAVRVGSGLITLIANTLLSQHWLGLTSSHPKLCHTNLQTLGQRKFGSFSLALKEFKKEPEIYKITLSFSSLFNFDFGGK